MAGHSKWANIKHKKGRADARKGKVFSKLAKEIISAVKQGGNDPKANTHLRLALQKAKEANVPNEIIERNLKKGSHTEGNEYFTITYEIYGHGGVGILVDVVTDNKNRIASDIRIATNKRGGTIATPGSVAFQFERKAIIQIDGQGVEEEILFAQILELEAEDFIKEEQSFIVMAPPTQLYQLQESLDSLGYQVVEADIQAIPQTYIACEPSVKEANLSLIDWLEGIDDVDEVFHNMEM